MPATSPTRDTVVIGDSAGALEVLTRILAGLSRDLPAAVFVVLHVGEVSYLPAILGRSSALPVVAAKSGAPIEQGKVHVGTPGVRLLLHDSHILLRRGPHENLARPAIDPLFRSAAASLGSRFIGVLLSGALSDGTAGLRAIKRCGGIAVVQEPRDAIVPDMPRSALDRIEVDHVCPAAAIASHEPADMRADDMLGTISPFTCPECRGALWEIADGSMLRFRCHVGHAFTGDAILSAQGEEIGRMLGTLQRSHRERAVLARKMTERERAEERHALADLLEGRAREYEEDAQLVLELMRNGFAAAVGAMTENGKSVTGDAEVDD